MVQYFHRYTMCSPSIHPDTRQRYRWIDELANEPVNLPPEPGELPELPWTWIEGLAIAKGATSPAATPQMCAGFIDGHTEALFPEALVAVRKLLDGCQPGQQDHGRHDTLITAACWGMREAAAGLYPAGAVVEMLRECWQAVIDDPKRLGDDGGGEFGSAIAFAIGQTEADPERVAAIRAKHASPTRIESHARVDLNTAEILEPGNIGTGGKAPNARDLLLELVQSDYTIGRTEDERVYLVPHNGPNLALFSGQAKPDLARRHLETVRKSVGRTPLDEAWTTIEGLALDVTKAALPLRVATYNARSIVDIGDTTGRVIIVSPNGWDIADRSPVTFRRSRAMLPLTVPVRGGDIDELFTLLNVAADDRDLFGAWLTSTLIEQMPHPVPVLRGEQGAAKSAAARAVTRLVDPCMASTQKPPRTDEEWSQSCSARWIVAVDNVSTVPEWWSDAICRAVTGAGWLRRALYTDDDVVVTTWR